MNTTDVTVPCVLCGQRHSTMTQCDPARLETLRRLREGCAQARAADEVAGGLVASMLHDLVAGAALHCLDASAPGISADLRRAVANNIARRVVRDFAELGR